MAFTASEKFNASIIHISGNFFGSIDGPEFTAKIHEFRDKRQLNVIIDLSDATLMDSTGVGLLIGALTTMRKEGGDVRLAGLQKRIRNLFLMTRLLGPVFNDYETVEEAARSFETDPPAAPASEEEAKSA